MDTKEKLEIALTLEPKLEITLSKTFEYTVMGGGNEHVTSAIGTGRTLDDALTDFLYALIASRKMQLDGFERKLDAVEVPQLKTWDPEDFSGIPTTSTNPGIGKTAILGKMIVDQALKNAAAKNRRTTGKKTKKRK